MRLAWDVDGRGGFPCLSSRRIPCRHPVWWARAWRQSAVGTKRRGAFPSREGPDDPLRRYVHERDRRIPRIRDLACCPVGAKTPSIAPRPVGKSLRQQSVSPTFTRVIVPEPGLETTASRPSGETAT